MSAAGAPCLKIKLQVYCGGEIAMGPGKADLLDAIEAAGSISAAARAIGMSYRRAWMLVDTMNRCWDAPLVQTAPGGRARAGARITDAGRTVLAAYRALQDSAEAAHRHPAWTAMSARLLAAPADREAGA